MMVFESSSKYGRHQIRGGRWFSCSSPFLKWVGRNAKGYEELVAHVCGHSWMQTLSIDVRRTISLIRSLLKDGMAHAFASSCTHTAGPDLMCSTRCWSRDGFADTLLNLRRSKGVDVDSSWNENSCNPYLTGNIRPARCQSIRQRSTRRERTGMKPCDWPFRC